MKKELSAGRGPPSELTPVDVLQRQPSRFCCVLPHQDQRLGRQLCVSLLELRFTHVHLLLQLQWFSNKIKKKISNRHNVLISPQVNFILFLCIVRILRQKINCPDIGRNESNQYSWASFLTANLNFCLLESVSEKGSLITKAEGPYICFCFCCFRRLAKSMLLLIPLFGINFILFAFIPEQVKTELRLIFDLILGSFQVWHQRFWLDCGADLQSRKPEAGWCDTVEFLNYYFAVKEFANWAKVKQCSQKLGRRWLRWAAFKLQSHHLASCQVWPASVFYRRRVWQHSRHRSGWFSGTSLLFISPISSGNVERWRKTFF